VYVYVVSDVRRKVVNAVEFVCAELFRAGLSRSIVLASLKSHLKLWVSLNAETEANNNNRRYS
jgi:hypothetical protein